MKHLLPLKILPRELIFLIMGFVVFTVVGTLTHELGHIAVARALGFRTHLSYGSMTWNWQELNGQIRKLYKQHESEIEAGADFKQKRKLESLSKKFNRSRIWISAGGPLQTILFGCLGLILLIKGKKNSFGLRHWFLVFLALFWLRQPFNLVSALMDSTYPAVNTDEVQLAELLSISRESILYITAIVGLLVSCYVVFVQIPARYRLTFILAGFIGGLSGFKLWFTYIGPYILP